MDEEGLRSKKLAVIDNGSQYGRLWEKAYRDLGIEVDMLNAGVYEDDSGKKVKRRVSLEDILGYAGVVVAGGRACVLDSEQRADIDPKIYTEFKNPVMGVCYGHQDMADRMGGKVEVGRRQCGPVYTDIDTENPLFSGLHDNKQRVTATHNDGVTELPPGFRIIAESAKWFAGYTDIDAMCREPEEGKSNWRFGTQFHPETFLTDNGQTMLLNFANICGVKQGERPIDVMKSTPNIDSVVKRQYKKVKRTIKDKHIFAPLSGGIDSTVAMKMVFEAGVDREKVHAFHIDTGFNRYEESETVVAEYHKMGWDVELIDAKDFFANFSLSEEQIAGKRKDLAGKGFGGIKLKDAVYSEHKRLLVQAAYDETIEKVMKRYGVNYSNSVLLQGTNQADKVESAKGGSTAGKSGSAHIKTHHNVGSKFVEEYEKRGNLLEPMDAFYKQDIYELGRRFGLPEYFEGRRPFPGPGLLIRMGNHDMIESEKYTKRMISRLEKTANRYTNMLRVSTYVTPIEAVGNCGDERAVGAIAVIQRDNDMRLEDSIDHLKFVAGQIPHYTTRNNNDCITRVITPLFGFNAIKRHSFSPMKHSSEYAGYLQIFDHEVGKIVKEMGLEMTQLVNYMVNDNLGNEGKYTFVFRPWLAPNLMTGVPAIPMDRDKREELFGRMRALKDKYDFIGNICVDLTYKPIGGTEIN